VARGIAIAVEILILAAVGFSMLWAVRISLFDLWLGPKYRPMVTLGLSVIGAVYLVYLVAHLVSFYPP
jgi:hypothetical protein